MAHCPDDVITLRLAWQEALRVRGCPPEDVLCGEPVPENLRSHLNSCPWCEDDREDLKALIGHESRGAGHESRLGTRDPRPATCDSGASGQAELGDVVRLAHSLSGWGPKNRFYNPPLVILVEALQEPAGAFRVALVHDFPDLAGPWDVQVAPGVFAEPWNTFACLSSHWDCRVLRVSASVLDEVRRRAQNPSQAFSAEKASALDPRGAFLSAFRRLEMEVAAFFAQRVLQDLMDHYETPVSAALSPFFKDPEAFRTAFGAWLQLDIQADPSLKTILTAPWVEAFLPMAAAPQGKILSVRIVRLQESGPVLEPVTAELTICEATARGVIVGGKVLKNFSEAAEMHAVWLVSGREIWPEEAMLDTPKGYFRLLFPRFPRHSALLQNLYLAVIDR
ncbi:MAG: hypothetical protein ACUVWY_13275 [Desulfosoma sp.]|uniref:hypothetical protein n=1 Tax=Desulfosoma sp. TaxID=2603217 RepID=UPI0040496311